MGKPSNRRPSSHREFDADEVLYDVGNLLPERVVRAWMKELRDGNWSPIFVATRLADGTVVLLDSPCRVEALRRCGFTKFAVDFIDHAPAHPRPLRAG